MWRRRPSRYRVFFATDIHGSDRCFRKFLAAASVYDADALILGGDLAGKAIVPVVSTSDGRIRFGLHGERRELPAAAVDEACAMINFCGYYPIVCDDTIAAQIGGDAQYRNSVFERLIASQLEDWCELVAARLDEGVRCIITPGNDDPLWVEGRLRPHAQRVECPEGATIEVGPVRLASLGSTNRTPWATHRECEEEKLALRIEAMLSSCDDGESLVFNFHAPPYDSGLDTAAKLTPDLSPVTRHGTIATEPVGSQAVREAIESYGPTVGLHGHIHESRGATRIGRTICLNPGSDYDSGLLRGALVDFRANGNYFDHLLTAG